MVSPVTYNTITRKINRFANTARAAKVLKDVEIPRHPYANATILLSNEWEHSSSHINNDKRYVQRPKTSLHFRKFLM